MSVYPYDAPSFLYRRYIENITYTVEQLVKPRVLFLCPHGTVDHLKALGQHFYQVRENAYKSCVAIDTANSVPKEDKANSVTLMLLKQLVSLRNEAMDLLENRKFPESHILR